MRKLIANSFCQNFASCAYNYIGFDRRTCFRPVAVPKISSTSHSSESNADVSSVCGFDNQTTSALSTHERHNTVSLDKPQSTLRPRPDLVCPSSSSYWVAVRFFCCLPARKPRCSLCHRGMKYVCFAKASFVHAMSGIKLCLNAMCCFCKLWRCCFIWP